MNMPSTFLPAFLLLTLLNVISAQSCFTGCSFSLCSGETTLTAGKPDVSLTGSICDDNGKEIENIASTGEALVDGTKNISTYAPDGLRQSFASTFFKAFGGGIGHEAPQQNQASFIPNLCIAVPLLAYSVKEANNVTMNYMSTDVKNCVALRVVLGESEASPTAPSVLPPNTSPVGLPSMPSRPSTFMASSMSPSPFTSLTDSLPPIPSGIIESLPPQTSIVPEPAANDELESTRTVEPVPSIGSEPTLTFESLTPRPSTSSGLLN